eukprot:366462-Chlamydomonas_euryale.AAC.32
MLSVDYGGPRCHALHRKTQHAVGMAGITVLLCLSRRRAMCRSDPEDAAVLAGAGAVAAARGGTPDTAFFATSRAHAMQRGPLRALAAQDLCVHAVLKTCISMGGGSLHDISHRRERFWCGRCGTANLSRWAELLRVTPRLCACRMMWPSGGCCCDRTDEQRFKANVVSVVITSTAADKDAFRKHLPPRLPARKAVGRRNESRTNAIHVHVLRASPQFRRPRVKIPFVYTCIQGPTGPTSLMPHVVHRLSTHCLLGIAAADHQPMPLPHNNSPGNPVGHAAADHQPMPMPHNNCPGNPVGHADAGKAQKYGDSETS